MTSQITGPRVCSISCSGKHQSKIKVLRYWPFERGTYRSPMNSLNEGPIMCFQLMTSSWSIRKTIIWTDGDTDLTWISVLSPFCKMQLFIDLLTSTYITTLQWRHNGHDGVSNQQCLDCSLSRWSRRRSKKTSKFCVAGLCEGNSLTGEFSSQRASNAEIVFIWWCHHESKIPDVGGKWPKHVF